MENNKKKKKLSTKALTKIFAIFMLILILVPIIYGTYISVKPFIDDQIKSTSNQ